MTGQDVKLLTGRYLIEHVFPLSFREILHDLDIIGTIQQRANKPKLLSIMENMLNYGSMPQVYKTNSIDLKRDILTSYFDAILYKDCISNNSIRDSGG